MNVVEFEVQSTGVAAQYWLIHKGLLKVRPRSVDDTGRDVHGHRCEERMQLCPFCPAIAQIGGRNGWELLNRCTGVLGYAGLMYMGCGGETEAGDEYAYVA